jgi:hypothetical protein
MEVRNMKKVSLKKVAIVCAAVMMVSMVPIFAADTGTSTTTLNQHMKHQYKYQHGLNDSDKQINSNQNKVHCQNINCTQNCTENQHEYSYLNKNSYNCTGNCTS